MTCLSLWASLQQQSAFARLFLETCQDSTTGVCGNVTLFLRRGTGKQKGSRQSRSRVQDLIFHFHFPDRPCAGPFPAGTKPVHFSATKAGGRRQKTLPRAAALPCRTSPRSQALSRPAGQVSFPAGPAVPRRSALQPARLSAAMLRRCPPGPPGPPLLRRALPPAAPAVRDRLREVSGRGAGGGGGAGGWGGHWLLQLRSAVRCGGSRCGGRV